MIYVTHDINEALYLADEIIPVVSLRDSLVHRNLDIATLQFEPEEEFASEADDDNEEDFGDEEDNYYEEDF